MTKQQITKVVVFCLIVCMMLLFLCDLFEHKSTTNYNRRFYTYRTLEEDTVDAVFLGTSGVDRYWISAKAYEEYGMTVYPLSSDSCPAWLYKEVLEYAFKYQNPELIIIDIRPFCKENTAENMDIRARRILDAMPMGSKIWLDTSFKTMKTIHRLDETKSEFDLSLLLSFIRYHSRWVEEGFETSKNLGNRQHNYAGFFMSKGRSVRSIPQSFDKLLEDDQTNTKMDQISIEAFYEVIEFAKENNVKILFVDTPQFRTPAEKICTNQVYKLVEESGADWVTFYKEGPEEGFTIDFDYDVDFYNDGHVNYYGAEKFTPVFAEYLDKKYNLPDRRNDANAKVYWDGKYDIIKNKIKEYEAAEIIRQQEALNEPLDDEYAE